MLKSSSAAARIQDQAGMTPLHVACWSGNKATIRLLLEAYPQAAGTVDKRGRTPLHMACASAPTPAVETVSLLLEACPTSAHLRDHHGKTPLALLCERQQDRIKAGKDMLLMDKAGDKGGPLEATVRQAFDKALRPTWEQMTALLQASADAAYTQSGESSTSSSSDWSLVHVVASVPHCPSNLLELVVAMHPEQVRETVLGRLPLHLAIAHPSQPTDSDSPVQDNTDVIVSTLLNVYPEAAAVPDAKGRLPLHIATANGQRWDGVVRHLVQICPSAIYEPDPLVPFMLPFMSMAASSSLLSYRTTATTETTTATMKTTTTTTPNQDQLTCVMELLRTDPGTLNAASQR